MARPGRIVNVHVREAGMIGIGLYNVEGIVFHCSVDSAGDLAANTYDGIITSGADSGSRIEDNRVWGTGLRYGINVGTGVNVGGNRVIGNADTANYNFNNNTVHSRSYGAPFSRSGELEVVTGSHRLPIVAPGRIIAVRADVNVAPTGASVIVDVNKNGTTIFPTTTKPTIAAGQNMSGQSIPDITRIVSGDYLTIDIDQIGSTLPGEDLVVMVQIENDSVSSGET